MRGNVLDLAVGFIIGAAFGKIVASLVDDIMMPPVGTLLGPCEFLELFISLRQRTTTRWRPQRRRGRRQSTMVILQHDHQFSDRGAGGISAGATGEPLGAKNRLSSGGPDDEGLPAMRDARYPWRQSGAHTAPRNWRKRTIGGIGLGKSHDLECPVGCALIVCAVRKSPTRTNEGRIQSASE